MGDREAEINALLAELAILETKNEEEAKERVAIDGVMDAIESAVKAVNNALNALQKGFKGDRSKKYIEEMKKITEVVKGYKKSMNEEINRLGGNVTSYKKKIEMLRERIEQLRREESMEQL